MSEKIKCSGIRCPMQHNTVSVETCQCTDTCPDYTPVADFSGMDAVVEMAAKQFGIENAKDKQKLKILFNAYVGQYVASCFPLGGGPT